MESSSSDRPRIVRLLVLSFLSLFLEMLLIRWLSTEVRLFSHVRNLALIACFAGLGIGYALRRFRVPLLTTFVGSAVLVLASLPISAAGAWSLKNLSAALSFDDIYSWQPLQSFATLGVGMLAFLAVFALVVFMFVPLGQMLGDLFRESRAPLRDYSYNVLASLVGIGAFTAISVFAVAPPWWFLLALGPLIAFVPRGTTAQLVAALATTVAILWSGPMVPQHFGVVDQAWSPYQKIQIWRLEASPTQDGQGWRLSEAPFAGNRGGVPMYMLDVNDIAMMWMLDMSAPTLQANPWLSVPGKIEWYDFPYRIKEKPAEVLVIGAGGGNDLAAALRHGAQRVDAVEIDPKIAEFGRRLHPERPYDDPRVHLNVQDARRFFKTTDRKYDLIVFGQLDNTDYNVMSNFSNIRMDSYIYTRESMAEASRLLKPGGVMVVNFGAGELWGRRLYRLLEEATGQKPLGVMNDLQLRFPGLQNACVVGDLAHVRERIAADPALGRWMAERGRDWASAEPFPEVEDDWPYWYLPRKAVPTLPLLIIVFVGLLSLGLARVCFPSAAFEGHFFFLGAGFMLLEAHLITKLALLFGSTWMVNSGVIACVLALILAANFVVSRWAVPPALAYGALVFLLVLQMLVPPSAFLALPVWASLLLGLLFYCAPAFCAGLIFGRSFERSPNPDAALASNLLGAILGGLLENVSYLFGMTALLGCAIALYALSAFLMRRSVPIVPAPPGP